MKLAALCDQDTAVGLRLAGIANVFIVNHDDILSRWNTIREDHTIGVLLVTERIAGHLGKHLQEFRIQNFLPIIIEIPDKKGPIKDHVDFVSQLIKKAVGIEIKTTS